MQHCVATHRAVHGMLALDCLFFLALFETRGSFEQHCGTFGVWYVAVGLYESDVVDVGRRTMKIRHRITAEFDLGCLLAHILRLSVEHGAWLEPSKMIGCSACPECKFYTKMEGTNKCHRCFHPPSLWMEPVSEGAKESDSMIPHLMVELGFPKVQLPANFVSYQHLMASGKLQLPPSERQLQHIQAFMDGGAQHKLIGDELSHQQPKKTRVQLEVEGLQAATKPALSSRRSGKQPRNK